MILNCLKTKEPYVGPKSDCQISPIYLQFWWVLSYIFRLLSPIFLYFWTPKVLDTLHIVKGDTTSDPASYQSGQKEHMLRFYTYIQKLHFKLPWFCTKTDEKIHQKATIKLTHECCTSVPL